MQNRRIYLPPQAANTTTTTVLIDPTITSTAGSTGLGTIPQVYILLRHIRAVNTSATPYTVTMFYGTANTLAAIWSAAQVAGNSYLDWYGELRIDGGATKLYGGASNAAVYYNFDDAEIGVAG